MVISPRYRCYAAALLLTMHPAIFTFAQHTASPRERAGAVVFGQHCSACHGVRLNKNDAAYDLTAVIGKLDEARFLIGAKTARGSMPSYAALLSDADLGAVWAYVRRGHTPDLNDVPMESNH